MAWCEAGVQSHFDEGRMSQKWKGKSRTMKNEKNSGGTKMNKCNTEESNYKHRQNDACALRWVFLTNEIRIMGKKLEESQKETKTLIWTIGQLFAKQKISKVKIESLRSCRSWKSRMHIFFELGFTPCKAEQPLQGMELQEKKHKKRLQDKENLFKKNLQLKDVC